MRIYATAGLTFLAVFVFFILGSTSFLGIVQRVAVVKEVKGQAQVVRKGTKKVEMLSPKMLVQAGDKIKTGPDGKVRLHWVDDTEITVEPDSELVVTKCSFNKYIKSTNYLFFLKIGTVLSRIKKKLSKRSRFELRTPVVTAAVRGTVFETSVDASGTTKIKVLEGKVALALSPKKKVLIEKGKTVLVKPGGAISVKESKTN